MMTRVAWPCLLAACGGSTASDIVPPPEQVVAACVRPVDLPERALTQAEAEGYWGADRRALRGCAARHAALAAWALGQVKAEAE